MRNLVASSLVFAAVALSAPALAGETPAPKSLPTAAELKTLNARLAPVDLTADVSKLPENERRALAKIIDASAMMDPLFLRQVWSGNETLLMSLIQDQSELGKLRLEAF